MLEVQKPGVVRQGKGLDLHNIPLFFCSRKKSVWGVPPITAPINSSSFKSSGI